MLNYAGTIKVDFVVVAPAAVLVFIFICFVKMQTFLALIHSNEFIVLWSLGLIKLVAGTLAPRPATEITITRETPVSAKVSSLHYSNSHLNQFISLH